MRRERSSLVVRTTFLWMRRCENCRGWEPVIALDLAVLAAGLGAVALAAVVLRDITDVSPTTVALTLLFVVLARRRSRGSGSRSWCRLWR